MDDERTRTTVSLIQPRSVMRTGRDNRRIKGKRTEATMRHVDEEFIRRTNVTLTNGTCLNAYGAYLDWRWFESLFDLDCVSAKKVYAFARGEIEARLLPKYIREQIAGFGHFVCEETKQVILCAAQVTPQEIVLVNPFRDDRETREILAKIEAPLDERIAPRKEGQKWGDLCQGGRAFGPERQERKGDGPSKN